MNDAFPPPARRRSILSAVRLMQGAHFASATIWSAAVDWTVCATTFFPILCRRPATVP